MYCGRFVDGQRRVLAPDGDVIGDLPSALNPARIGLVRARVSTEQDKIDITYFGPDDLWVG